MEIKKLTCLIVKYTDLPKNIQHILEQQRECLSNGTFIEHYSEFPIKELTKGMECISEYYQDQCNLDGPYKFEGSLDHFITKYGLEFEIWLINQHFDLTGIDKILIHVSW